MRHANLALPNQRGVNQKRSFANRAQEAHLVGRAIYDGGEDGVVGVFLCRGIN